MKKLMEEAISNAYGTVIGGYNVKMVGYTNDTPVLAKIEEILHNMLDKSSKRKSI